MWINNSLACLTTSSDLGLACPCPHYLAFIELVYHMSIGQSPLSGFPSGVEAFTGELEAHDKSYKLVRQQSTEIQKRSIQDLLGGKSCLRSDQQASITA
jgi:hypothetical protein